MTVFYLLLGIASLSAQNLIRKSYSRRVDGGALIFSAVSSASACLFFLCSAGFKLNFVPGLIPYIVLFALGYGSAVVFSYLAIKSGPLCITSLISAYSLVIPTLYGLLVFKEQVGAWFYGGVALLALSLLFINLKKGSGGAKITAVWALFVTLSFAGNGLCSTAQTAQQKAFIGQYKSELMVAALAIVSLTLFILAVTVERRVVARSLKGGCLHMVGCGLINGASNMLVMVLVGMMNASLMFPLLSAGNILLTTAVSVIVYREKLSKAQAVGMGFGIASVVLLNL